MTGDGAIEDERVPDVALHERVVSVLVDFRDGLWVVSSPSPLDRDSKERL